MALLVRSPEMIPTVSARVFPYSNSNVRHAFMRKKVTVSARNMSGVKNQKSRLYVKFSAPVKEDCEISSQNYYVNMGHAVRCLREELPSLFYKEPNFDIYRFY
ncbi:unnamed protein product [Eruca vesicaria subsp. sativa]|uniref:Ribosomal protein S10 n=1 Tax=Eruca vesicaria subsp. sativa TaxID=29727 RepID=A0ABC8JD98_ERUVS|nr:unnamed protein product [Eruca vesicaria subsp. sativa]